MPGMMGQPQGQVVVQQQPTLKGQMPAPAPQAQAGGAATTAGIQQAAQQQPAMGGMPQQPMQPPAPPPQMPGAPLMPPPIQMPDTGLKMGGVLSMGATPAPVPPQPPAPPPPQGWVGPPISPEGQGPVTSQVPPIDQQPPMFPQNPMQKANMASALKTLHSTGFMKKSFGGMLGLFGLAGGAYGAGSAGKGRRTRGAVSGAVRGLGTGLGATAGAIGGLGLGAKFMESGLLRNHPNAELLAANAIGMGATGLGGLLGYKATGFMPRAMGLEDDEEQPALEAYKYSSFGVHTLNGPMVGSPQAPKQPPVVTTERSSKKVDPSSLFKQAGWLDGGFSLLSKAIPAATKVMPAVTNAAGKAQQLYSRVPKGIRSPLGGALAGEWIGSGIDQGAGLFGIDTGGMGSMGGMMLGGMSRSPALARLAGRMMPGGAQKMRAAGRFFTPGGSVGSTANNVRRGLVGTAIAAPFASAAGNAYVNNQTNKQIENVAQQAGFSSGQEGIDFLRNVNSGNIGPVISHMWSRLSPEQKMGLIGGGGLMAAGALGGATGLTGGLGTAGLMGAGALGLGMGTGLLPTPSQFGSMFGGGSGQAMQHAPAQQAMPQGPQPVPQGPPAAPQPMPHPTPAPYSSRNEFAMQSHLS